jgi:transposase
MLYQRARRSLKTSRQHLLNEAEALLAELPLQLRDQLPDTTAVRPRLRALARRRGRGQDAATTLRLRLLVDAHKRIVGLDADERAVCRELATLVRASGSTLDQLCGLATRSVAELLVEIGDARRFTTPGFARFNATAPIPASTAEGPGEPVRHRYNPGGNRRINAIVHRMAVTQLRCEPRAQALYANARARGHTKKEAMRVLKRHLSDVIHRRMLHDLAAQGLLTEPPRAHAGPTNPQPPTPPTTPTGPAARANLEQQARP